MGYPLFPHYCLPLSVTYLLRSLSNHCAAHSLWSQRCLHLLFFFFFLCYILCRILILWPGVEVVPPAWEAQRHNHWASRTTGHPGKSWFLHLRSPIVSSSSALASPSPGGPSWSTLATPSKSDHIRSTPHRWPYHLTCIYSFPISQACMGITEDKINPFLI